MEFHSPMQFIGSLTSPKPPGASELRLMLANYCKTFNSHLYSFDFPISKISSYVYFFRFLIFVFRFCLVLSYSIPIFLILDESFLLRLFKMISSYHSEKIFYLSSIFFFILNIIFLVLSVDVFVKIIILSFFSFPHNFFYLIYGNF